MCLYFHQACVSNNRDFSFLTLEHPEQFYLSKLQSVEVASWIGELEKFLRHHPGLQSFQLAGSQIGGVMLHQVTLELIKQKVDMGSHRMSHSIVPAERNSFM